MNGFDMVYALQLLGGCALIIIGAVWSMKNTRMRGEFSTEVCRRMMVLFLLGGLLVFCGVFGFARP